MNGTTEMYRLLAQMDSTLKGCETLRDANALAAWTDETALRQLRSLVTCALGVMVREPIPSGPAVAATDPAPQSSVTLKQTAKGDTQVEVKVYDADPAQAMLRAANIYDLTVAKYAEEAKVTAGCQHCGEPHGVSVPCGFRREGAS